ncbi:MAG: hypothetical protein CVU07_13405 [Bacteroidetes bacterium HGW-Bacteroidetes-23]|nr:MAG: hypothetical protein CVU07_13405 [Bacteroidetes bacterium HGW-Bacteroidetes-23]
MIHKRSSSIVKWILMISIGELILSSGLNFLTVDDNYLKTLEMYHIYTLFQVLTIVNFIILVVFIYVFYKNFKTISTTDTVKKLMSSIIKTRKTVQYYIWYNLFMVAFIFIVVSISQVMYEPNIKNALNNIDYADSKIFWIVIILSYLALFAITFGLFWLFYRLIYGFLMRRLHKNYEELKKMDF